MKPHPHTAPPAPESLDRTLTAAIARTAARMHHDWMGRGPTRSRAFIRHDVIVVVLEGVLTPMEHSLLAAGRAGAVARLRQEAHAAIGQSIVGAIEELTARDVTASTSDTDLEADVTSLVFLVGLPLDDEHVTGGVES